MGDFTSEKEQKLLESEAEVSNTEDTNADELTFEETFLLSPCIPPHTVILNFVNLLSYFITTIIQSQYLHF